MKIDYTKLDAAILNRVATRKQGNTNTMAALRYSVDVEKELLDVHKQNVGSTKPLFRYLDSRLQVLRKAGKIAYDTKKGWSLV